MTMRHDASEENRLNRLDRAVLRAKAALAWEWLWPRIVPALTVAGLFVAQAPVLVEEPTGHIGMVDDGDVAS